MLCESRAEEGRGPLCAQDRQRIYKGHVCQNGWIQDRQIDRQVIWQIDRLKHQLMDAKFKIILSGNLIPA